MFTRNHTAVVVLVANEREELAELLPIMPLFRRVKIILILPDREPETIKLGYQLEPRFLSFIDSGFTMVKEVVQRMLNQDYRLQDWHNKETKELSRASK